MNNQQKPVQLKVSLDKTLPVICESCGCQAFQEALMLRKVSKFLTGDAQDGVLPIQTFVCVKCGHINEDFMPKELKKPEAPFETKKSNTFVSEKLVTGKDLSSLND